VVATAAAAPTPSSVQWKPSSRTLTTTVGGRPRPGSEEGLGSAPWLDAVATEISSANATHQPSPLVMLVYASRTASTEPEHGTVRLGSA
jgi:hypothetical protein